MLLNPMTDLFLQRRGYTPDFLRHIEQADHAPLLDVDALCARLADIRADGRHIVIVPDFDMDGIASGVLGFAGLTELGFRCSLFRLNPADGYGFDAAAIDRLVSEFGDADAIITCDVGITCYDGVQRAHDLGIEVLVTDHHMQESADKLAADVIVDPCRLDETYALKGICGAHVLWQVLDRFCALYEPSKSESIALLRVFAGIGTVSDTMPLLHENRQLVRDACAICRLVLGDGETTTFLDSLEGCDIYRSAFWGLRATLDVFMSAGKIKRSDDIDESFFGFYFAPTFNAAKRMGGSMDDVFGVFFSDDRYIDAQTLFMLNEERKDTVKKAMSDLMGQPQPYAPYIFISDAQPGILGLLATQLVRDTGMPCMVLTQDKGKQSWHGSGRSPEWYPTIDRVGGEGFYVAGHQGAYGVGLTDNRELKSLSAFLNKDVPEVMGTVDISETAADITIGFLQPDVDFDINPDLFMGFYEDMERLKPFGRSFEPPVIECRFPVDACDPKVIGSSKQHLKFSLPFGFDILCWNQADKLHELESADVVSVTGHLDLGEAIDVHPGENWYEAKQAAQYDPGRVHPMMQFVGDASVCPSVIAEDD